MFARSAFGDLYLCGERAGKNITINCKMNGIIALSSDLKPKTAANRDSMIRSFFGASRPKRFDHEDDSGQPMFERALAKLGPLAEDEVYGFEPALVAGGSDTLDHLHKLKLDQHLTILRQLAKPVIPFGNVDVEALLR